MGRGPDLERREIWRRRLREFDRGSVTVAGFCQRIGVSVATFYQWRRKMAASERIIGAVSPPQTVTRTRLEATAIDLRHHRVAQVEPDAVVGTGAARRQQAG